MTRGTNLIRIKENKLLFTKTKRTENSWHCFSKDRLITETEQKNPNLDFIFQPLFTRQFYNHLLYKV